MQFLLDQARGLAVPCTKTRFSGARVIETWLAPAAKPLFGLRPFEPKGRFALPTPPDSEESNGTLRNGCSGKNRGEKKQRKHLTERTCCYSVAVHSKTNTK